MRALCLVVLLAATAGCHPRPPPWFGTDGPQVEPSEAPRPKGEPKKFGTHCPTGCAMATMVIGFFSVPHTVLTIAMGPRKIARRTHAWAWAGVGFGATLLAIGGTHAVLNRHELASDAIVPLAIALPTGGASLVLGIIGLTTRRGTEVPTGGVIACEGARCRAGIPTPSLTPNGVGLTLATGRF
jgi:hypothetical protein